MGEGKALSQSWETKPLLGLPLAIGSIYTQVNTGDGQSLGLPRMCTSLQPLQWLQKKMGARKKKGSGSKGEKHKTC